MSEGAMTQQQVEEFLPELAGWQYSGNQLHKSFRFDSFSEAIGFMVRAALLCEQMNHHPNWYNVYGKVDVQLWTHSARGVTALDIRLAQKFNEIAGK
jgi:4a-hydroxytetrahydrobiopterin dehydratase